MRLIYHFFNGFWVDRLITQHRFESIASSPEALRIIRARRAMSRLVGEQRRD
jgi:hypothetical protein